MAERLRCPVCGHLVAPSLIDAAGGHRLEMGSAHGLGRGRGFRWEFWPLSDPDRQRLIQALERALDHLQEHLQEGKA